MSKPKTEVESKLLIIDPDPASFLRYLSRKSAISTYQLIKQGRLLIRDVYLDTPEAQLKNHRLALRLRKQNNQYFLTLKGKTKISDWGGVERMEVELSCSLTSYRHILDILKNNGVVIDNSSKNISLSAPLDILKDPSFTVIQDRETRRLIRGIVSPHEPQKVLAELALDTVTFHLVDQSVLQAEIELEAKDVDGQDTVRELTDYFIQQYPENLRSWPISKLSTGILLERLQQETDIRRFINKQHYLLPEIFNLLQKRINGISE